MGIRKIGRAESGMGRERKNELDFCLRPIPHLGACSQANLVQEWFCYMTYMVINVSTEC